ncbi:MAG: mannose-1-phosphate guanylyltransferase/mannose-6-phosphate isomerase [Cellvibrionales bacterium]|nr:mannose-1-phosphate guanylyltransferase/mannose-6-phosphate isomerase [Cellvibrionales bacterium]
MSTIIPVVLSGGSGTRLWPLSRKHYPKQLLPLVTDNTLLQDTLLRVDHLANPIIVCNNDHRFMVAEQVQSIGLEAASIILEPVARNTAPAIALAAFEAATIDSEAIIAVFAADHVILDQKNFRSALDMGITAASMDKLATFGIVPTHPETGYGYIKSASKTQDAEVLEFVEKPDLATAEQYLESGDYLWNSGMFVFKAQVYLNELKQFAPKTYKACEEGFSKAQKDLDFLRIDEAAFSQATDDSVDYVVMEKTQKAWVVPMDAGWSDVGSWSSLWDVSGKDENGNVNRGDVISIDSTDCYFESQDKLIAAIGLDDLVVINTKDALLLAKKDRVQEVKKIVSQLKADDRHEHLLHREVYRPWGSYDSIESGERYQVKRITVKPGASLSLQMHYHRSEHWVVVEGSAVVMIDDTEHLLSPNESVYIPLGSKHRLTNPGKIPLQLIEVQSGTYLGEDDIVRFEDNYGRTS